MKLNITNDVVTFKGEDVSKIMDIQEINIHNDEVFVTGKFKADVDLTKDGVLFGMVEDMQLGNLIDLKEVVESELDKRGCNGRF